MGRLRHVARLLKAELGALHRAGGEHGLEQGLRARLEHHAGTAAIRSRLEEMTREIGDLARWAEAADRQLNFLVQTSARAGELEAVRTGIRQLQTRVGHAEEGATALRATAGEHAEHLQALHRTASLLATSEWVDQAHLVTNPLVSVILPTCNRRAMAARGRMPTVARLLDDSASSVVTNPYGLFVGTLWTTFFTALCPTRTNFYCWEEIDPATYERRLTSPLELRGVPFWETLSAADRRVAVVGRRTTAPALLPEPEQLRLRRHPSEPGRPGTGGSGAARP